MSTVERLLSALRERGAAAISHSGATLLKHLIRTHEILQESGADENLCRAGLFHSVYGTERFSNPFHPPWERDDLRELIGSRSETLVFLFSQLSRETLLQHADADVDGPLLLPCQRPGDYVRISKRSAHDLLAVHRANRQANDEARRSTDKLTRSVRPTFLKLESSSLTEIPSDTRAAFLGVPSDAGSHRGGSRNGPRRLRKESISLAHRSSSYRGIVSISGSMDPIGLERVVDLGDVRCDREGVDGILGRVEAAVRCIPHHCIPICVGGDHTFTLGALRGRVSREQPFRLIQFDHHLDLQIWGEFRDGRPATIDPPMHANVMSHIMSEFTGATLTQIGVQPYASIPVDENGPSAAVLRYLKEVVRDRITDHEASTMSIATFIQRMPIDEDIYVTIDVDVLAGMSDTGYPAATGVPFHRLVELLSVLFLRNHVLGVDVMEFADFGATDRKAAQMGTTLLLKIVELLSSSRSHSL